MNFKRKFHRSFEIIQEEGPKIFFKKLMNILLRKYCKLYAKNFFEKKGFDYLSEGTQKVVYRRKEYVAAFIPKDYFPLESKISLVEKMRKSREWYRKHFGEKYLNREKIFEKRNLLIWMQEYKKFQEKDLFFDIVENKEKIISFFQKRDDLKEDLISLFEKILEVYYEKGLVPDFFNSCTSDENPANFYLTEDNQLVFIDSHTVKSDRRKMSQDDCYFCDQISQANEPYLDSLLLAIKTIVEQLKETKKREEISS